MLFSGSSSSSASRSSAAREASLCACASARVSACTSFGGSLSARISGGSVSPCTTSVPMTVVKVRKRMRFRCGTDIGTEKAMASETTPRIPAHPTITGAFQSVSGSRSRIRGDIQRGTKVAGNTHRNRATTTARNTAIAYQAACRPSYSPSPLRTTGSWSPISAKTTDSSTKATTLHTASSWSRVAKSTCQFRCPRYSATTTTASTPEACTRSAAAYATKGISSDRVFWSRGSLSRVRRWWIGTISSRPTAMPPTEASRNSSIPPAQPALTPIAAASATL